jgi:hypothetical protein
MQVVGLFLINNGTLRKPSMTCSYAKLQLGYLRIPLNRVLITDLKYQKIGAVMANYNLRLWILAN